MQPHSYLDVSDPRMEKRFPRMGIIGAFIEAYHPSLFVPLLSVSDAFSLSEGASIPFCPGPDQKAS